ncbi:MAG: glycosyltransferase family 2 protein [Actinomycetota bacterium]|nr:glycosyltransferase family 2 protein [Actinomycetota bacterium]
MLSVSVVVPVHNGADALPELLAALASQEGVGDVEVVVVDNASTDTTAEVAGASPVVTRVVHEPQPGSYVARNAGWRTTSGEVVAFTDADCVPSPGWLAGLLGALAEGELAAGAVVPGPPPAGRWAAWWAAYDRAMYLDQKENVERDGFAATANLAVRRQVLEELDGFDDALVSGGDFAFTRAATSAGHRLVWAPAAPVLHRPRAALRSTWSLWRRLGRGYGDLAAQGSWPRALRHDPVLRAPLAQVTARARSRGVSTATPVLALAHTVARLAVLRGRLDRPGTWSINVPAGPPGAP